MGAVKETSFSISKNTFCDVCESFCLTSFWCIVFTRKQTMFKLQVSRGSNKLLFFSEVELRL